MSKANDTVKREAWRRRLERFEAGDLSIAQFCRDEGVGTHTFYYWSKQLGRTSGRKGGRNGRSRAGTRSPRSRPKQCLASTTESKVVSTSEPVIHFTWDSRLSFSVPADCLDAIRCVLQYASHSRAGSADGPPLVNAFRQLIVD